MELDVSIARLDDAAPLLLLELDVVGWSVASVFLG